MRARRVLLIEAVDAAGAAARDARVRAKALLLAGCEVRSASVEPHRAAALHHAPDPASALPRFVADVHGRRGLRRWLAESDADLALVASAIEGGGEVGRWLDRVPGLKARWWPTGAHGRARPLPAGGSGHSASMGSMRRPGPLPPLVFDDAVGVPSRAPWPLACAGLDASLLTETRLSRGQLPLWDGDYVLAPMPLSGAAGHAVIDAFAVICAEHDGLDLVVLADPQPVFERLARARGIGFRVHFAGEAPRDAELAWLGAATAALVAGDHPVSGGLVLRALARGCPLLGAPGAAPARPIEAWLAVRGVAIGGTDEPLAARLEQAFARDSVWLAAAHAVAVRHGLERAAGRLASALDAALAGRRAA